MAFNRVALAVLCVALVATYLAGADARTDFPGRSLQQDFKCSSAKALSGNCDALCQCVAKDPAYAGQTDLSQCTGPCQACVDATQNCPADDSLPGACSSYAGNQAVMNCISGGGRRLA